MIGLVVICLIIGLTGIMIDMSDFLASSVAENDKNCGLDGLDVDYDGDTIQNNYKSIRYDTLRYNMFEIARFYVDSFDVWTIYPIIAVFRRVFLAGDEDMWRFGLR